MKKNILILGVVFSLFGCEGSKFGNGIVYDSSSSQPLDSVKYKRTDSDFIQYTDSLGKWAVEGPFGGCNPECMDFSVDFSKDGYKMQTLVNPDRSEEHTSELQSRENLV